MHCRVRALLVVVFTSFITHHVSTFSLSLSPSTACVSNCIRSNNVLVHLKTGNDDDNEWNVDNEIDTLDKIAKSDQNALTSMLESLPDAEKYGLLIQSISSQIIEDGSRKKNSSDFMQMEDLYSEMIGKAITPSERSSQQLINAACTFYDCNIIGKALSLVKRGGSCKVYGSGIGSLTKASFDSQYAVELPSDNREGEISAALFALTGAVAYVSIQVASIANSELHPWATLIGVLIVLSAAVDISFRKGFGLKDASAGLQRLVLQDDEREEFIEASGLMMGYLLGLPCFAFQPDVMEAINMLRESKPAMDAYKAQRGKKTWSPSQATTLNNYEDDDDTEDIMNALGRVLVWMSAPVAAETMKYGSTLIADPRKPRVFLDLFLSKENKLAVIVGQEGKEELLKWSYGESVAFLERYGDVLEDVRAYLQTKSSSAGECAMLLEDRLS